MANAAVIKPDTAFIREVISNGGDDLKKCYQCATCTAVCTLSGDSSNFPRQQILKAQWGMRDALVGDPAVWLCHDCGECTKRCPRGARPSRTMGAIRSAIIKQCSYPKFMGVLVSSPLGHSILFLLPAFILAFFAVVPPRTPAGSPYEFAQMFPQSRIEPLFFIVAGLSILAAIAGTLRLIRATRACGLTGPILAFLGPALIAIARHERFAKCDANQTRRWGHILVSYSFVGLGAVGTIIGIGTMIGAVSTPLPLLSPLKIFANICAGILLAGVVLLFIHRLGADTRLATTYFDWFLLSLLGGVAATGIASEVLRLGQSAPWMYAVYFVHLTLIFALFLYAPYSKFAHLVYRTVAIAATWDRGHKAIIAPPATLPDQA